MRWRAADSSRAPEKQSSAYAEPADQKASSTRDACIQSFEKRLNCAMGWALFIGFLHAVSKFLGFCLLCYIPWFLLRSSTSTPSHLDGSTDKDFPNSREWLTAEWLSMGLLILEGVRFTIASFVMRLLVHPLASESQAPSKIRPSEDRHYRWLLIARCVSYLAQLVFLFLSLALNLYTGCIPCKLCKSHYNIFFLSLLAVSGTLVAFCTLTLSGIAFYSVSSESSPQQISIPSWYFAQVVCIISFWAFISFTGCIPFGCKPDNFSKWTWVFLVAFILSLVFFIITRVRASYFVSSTSSPQRSILRYFDAVLERAITSGLVSAYDFEFFRFAYALLGGEFSRHVQPEAVAKSHKDLIQYLYYNRLGPDFLQIFMDEKDAWVQLAAVNIVGFWVDRTWGVGLPESEVKLPRELLKKLTDKVGTGQVGWAAATSIGVLAVSSPGRARMLVQTCSSSGQSLSSVLADSIDVSSNRSLSIVRTLLRLYEQLYTGDVEEGPPEIFMKEECSSVSGKLKTLAEKATVQRLRVQAAYLLTSLNLWQDSNIKSIVEAIKPTKDDYWYQSEMQMLEFLYLHIGLSKDQAPRPHTIRKDKKEEDQEMKPPWWLKAETSSVASAATKAETSSIASAESGTNIED